MSKSEPLPEGTVIMADNQFAGRGQQQNTWHAEPGKNLTFSLYLKPAFLPIQRQFLLNMAISIALNDALTGLLGAGIKIKWPNDLYYHQQKLGGILIENMLNGITYKSSIIGIGLNVNQQAFAPELQDRATSVYQILHQDVNLVELLAEICSQIEKQYLKLKVGNYANLQTEYLHRLYRLNERCMYRHNGQVFEGEITRVSEQGMLVIAREGIEKAYNFKEVEFLK